MLINLGTITRSLGKFDQAENYLEEAIEYSQTYGGGNPINAHLSLGFVALHKGDVSKAVANFFQALVLSQELPQPHYSIICIGGFAALEVVREVYIFAARWFGAYQTYLEEMKPQSVRKEFPVRRYDLPVIEEYLVRCREQMEAGAFDQAWKAGQRLTLAEVINEILEQVGESN